MFVNGFRMGAERRGLGQGLEVAAGRRARRRRDRVWPALGWHDTAKLLAYQPLGIDFLPMWAAAHEVFVHPHRVYDFVRLTHFEQPQLVHFPFRGLRPFVYPPPALLVFAPFGRAPFALANLVWTAVGLFAILLAMSTQVKSPRVLVAAGHGAVAGLAAGAGDRAGDLPDRRDGRSSACCA